MNDSPVIISIEKRRLSRRLQQIVMEVDEESIQAKVEEDVVYMEPEEGAMEVMKMKDSTVVSLEINAEVIEESVVGLESLSEYLHHHGSTHHCLDQLPLSRRVWSWVR